MKWIHETTEFNGKVYETTFCRCSECGYWTLVEQERCPKCGEVREVVDDDKEYEQEILDARRGEE